MKIAMKKISRFLGGAILSVIITNIIKKREKTKIRI